MVSHLTQRFRRIKEYLFLLAALLLVYLPALNGGFLVDDTHYISESALVAGTSSPWHFWTGLNQPDYWPLFYTFVWTLWHWFGAVSWPYHVLNVALHAANALLFGRVLSLYGMKRFRLWGIALFAFHPLCVESVAWIFQLKTLLSTFFALLSFLAYARAVGEGSRKNYFVSVACFAVAVLCKTSVVFFPFAFALHELWRGGFRLKRSALRLVPFFLLSFFAGVMTLIMNSNTFSEGGLWSASFLERLLVSSKNLLFYISKALLPYPLRFVYRWEGAPPSQAVSWIPSLVCVGAVVALRRRLRADRAVFATSLLLAFFFLNLAPALGFVSVPYMRYSMTADHYAYLSLLGFAFLAVALLEKLAREARWVWVFPVLFAWASVYQSSAYQSPDALWARAVADNSNSVFALFNEGATFASEKRYAEAVEPFRRAAFGPSDAPEYLVDSLRQSSMNAAARALMEVGRNQEAAETLEALLKKNPDFINADYNLAMIYHQKLGRLDRAEELYAKSLEGEHPTPETAESVLPAQVNLCDIAVRKKSFALAINRCANLARLHVKSQAARINLGRAYLGAGDAHRALKVFESYAHDFGPTEEVYTTLGELYLKSGDKRAAKWHFERALEINPYNGTAARYLSSHGI